MKVKDYENEKRSAYPSDDGTSAAAHGQQEQTQNQHPAHSSSGTNKHTTKHSKSLICVSLILPNNVCILSRGGVAVARGDAWTSLLIFSCSVSECGVFGNFWNELCLFLSLISLSLYPLTPPPSPPSSLSLWRWTGWWRRDGANLFWWHQIH